MTQIGSLGTSVDLKTLYSHIPVSGGGCITYAVYGYEDKGHPIKAKKVRADQTDVKGRVRKRYFFNQVTLHIDVGKTINLKIFNNGGIQMTGLRTPTQGADAIMILKRAIMGLSNDIVSRVFLDDVDPVVGKSRMVMINSDFDIGFKVNREILHRMVIEQGLYSHFNDEVYPGVNLKYYYNPIRQSTGICDCVGTCDGKGHGDFCKKITIAVFKSGKIIITGGQEMVHIHTAHEFICRFILENQELIRYRERTKEITKEIN
jgi:hypothetical protein